MDPINAGRSRIVGGLRQRYADQEFGGRWEDGCTEGVAEDPLGSFLGTSWVWVASLYRLATFETVTVDKFIADAFFFYHGWLPPLLLWGGLVGFLFIEWVATRKFTLFPWER